jgi:hypothetical protein
MAMYHQCEGDPDKTTQENIRKGKGDEKEGTIFVIFLVSKVNIRIMNQNIS